MKQIELFLTQR